MDKNSNINLQDVHGDFPISMDKQNSKHTHGQFLKKSYANFKIQWEIHCFTCLINDQNTLEKKLLM